MTAITAKQADGGTAGKIMALFQEAAHLFYPGEGENKKTTPRRPKVGRLAAR